MTNRDSVLRYHDEHTNYKDQFILENIIWQEPCLAASFEEDSLTDHEVVSDL